MLVIKSSLSFSATLYNNHLNPINTFISIIMFKLVRIDPAPSSSDWLQNNKKHFSIKIFAFKRSPG